MGFFERSSQPIECLGYPRVRLAIVIIVWIAYVGGCFSNDACYLIAVHDMLASFKRYGFRASASLFAKSWSQPRP